MRLTGPKRLLKSKKSKSKKSRSTLRVRQQDRFGAEQIDNRKFSNNNLLLETFHNNRFTRKVRLMWLKKFFLRSKKISHESSWHLTQMTSIRHSHRSQTLLSYHFIKRLLKIKSHMIGSSLASVKTQLIKTSYIQSFTVKKMLLMINRINSRVLFSRKVSKSQLKESASMFLKIRVPGWLTSSLKTRAQRQYSTQKIGRANKTDRLFSI